MLEHRQLLVARAQRTEIGEMVISAAASPQCQSAAGVWENRAGQSGMYKAREGHAESRTNAAAGKEESIEAFLAR